LELLDMRAVQTNVSTKYKATFRNVK